MTLVRVNAADSGSEFSILNLQTITRVDCRNFVGGARTAKQRCSSPMVAMWY
jgi:hypothetical protein